MGTVFLGWDELLERRVAIKVLHPSSALSGDAKVRFLREARVLSRLDHPGICTIHDILEHDGRDALILEFVDGVSLRKAIAEGSIPEEDRLAIAEAPRISTSAPPRRKSRPMTKSVIVVADMQSVRGWYVMRRMSTSTPL